MNKENRNFVIILCIAAVVLAGVIAENVIMTLRPPTALIQIDVGKVKEEIQKAGLVPREAMHWKSMP